MLLVGLLVVGLLVAELLGLTSPLTRASSASVPDRLPEELKLKSVSSPLLVLKLLLRLSSSGRRFETVALVEGAAEVTSGAVCARSRLGSSRFSMDRE